MAGFLSWYGFFCLILLAVIGSIKCFLVPADYDGEGNEIPGAPAVQTFSMIIISCLVGMPAAVVFFHINTRERFKDVFKTLPAYVMYAATYFHTHVIFAFCNMDDISWGMKDTNV